MAALVIVAGSLAAVATTTATASSSRPASVPSPSVDVETGPVAESSTAMSTTDREADGSYLLTSYTAPVNYRTDAGWEPIDNTLVDSSVAGYAAENAANSYVARIPEDGSARPVHFSVGGDWISMKMHGLDDAPTLEGDDATFDGVAAADRVVYTATNSGLKESVVLDEPPPPGMTAAYHYTIQTSPGLTPELGPDGSVQFRDGSGSVAMTIPRGHMVDSATVPAYRENVHFRLQPQPDRDGWVLTMTPAPAWLTDPARVFPVTIDPTITPGAVKDCWIHESEPDRSACGDGSVYVRVGRKAPDQRYRGLLAFDVSSIPGRAQVREATVTLSIDEAQTLGTEAVEYGAYTPAQDWHFPTWSSATTGIPWNAGDPGDDPASTRVLTGHEQTADFAGLAPLVRAWVRGTTPNHGLLVKQVRETADHLVWFRSSIAETGRPALKVRYSVVDSEPEFVLAAYQARQLVLDGSGPGEQWDGVSSLRVATSARTGTRGRHRHEHHLAQCDVGGCRRFRGPLLGEVARSRELSHPPRRRLPHEHDPHLLARRGRRSGHQLSVPLAPRRIRHL